MTSGGAPVGPAADIFALGAVLYEMLVGRPPFKGDSFSDTERRLISEEPTRPSRVNAKVPRDLETICLKCLEKDPKDRYATAGELAADLQRFLQHEPIRARPISPGERGMRWGPPQSVADGASDRRRRARGADRRRGLSGMGFGRRPSLGKVAPDGALRVGRATRSRRAFRGGPSDTRQTRRRLATKTCASASIGPWPI